MMEVSDKDDDDTKRLSISLMENEELINDPDVEVQFEENEEENEHIDSDEQGRMSLDQQRHRRVKRRSTLQEVYVLEFKDLEYSVMIPDPENRKNELTKQILSRIAGYAAPKRMLALMGSSGAGKSSLLDILAGRLSANSWKGSVTLNEQPVNQADFRRLSGYVRQEDALLPLFTVRETLEYAARLRVGADLASAKIDELVDEMVDMLDLNRSADTIVGDELHRGVSGGERRRVSIGTEIIHRPGVVFLDEPTSGLDSSTALQIVETLRLLSETGRTIVVTVHQPSMRVFNSFDDVLFLNAGKTVYYGPTSGVVDYMKENGIQVPTFFNIPEFFLEQVHEYEVDGKLHQLENDPIRHGNIGESISSLKLAHLNMSQVTKKDDTRGAQFIYANSTWGETRVLMRRNCVNFFRTKELFLARIGLSIFMGLVLGSLFFDAKSSMKASYMVFGVAFFMFTSLEALPFFIMERTVFTRESSGGAYRTSSYALAVSLMSFLYQIPPSVIFVCVSYFMVGLESTADSFFLYILAQLGVLVTGNALASLVSTLTADPTLGTTAGTALFAIFFLFSGFFIPREDIPNYWIWMHYLSSFKWPFESLAIAGYNENNVEDFAQLRFFDLVGVSVWRGIGVIYGYAIVCRFLFFLSLKYKHRGVRD